MYSNFSKMRNPTTLCKNFFTVGAAKVTWKGLRNKHALILYGIFRTSASYFQVGWPGVTETSCDWSGVSEAAKHPVV